MCYYAVYAAAPFLRNEFGLSRFTVGIVLAVVTLGYAVFLLPIGALTDRHGERLTLTVGLGGLAVGVALVAAAPTHLALLATTFVLRSFYGTAMPGTNKAIYDHIEPGRQNLAIGIKQVGVTAGSGASALLVTGISGFLFWQSGLLLTAVVSLGVAALFYASYRDSGDGQAGSRDFGGLATNQPYRALVFAGLFLGAAIYTTIGYTVLYVEDSTRGNRRFRWYRSRARPGVRQRRAGRHGLAWRRPAGKPAGADRHGTPRTGHRKC
jgi:MFS family permease